jgi:hypothetical protein
MNLDKKYQGTDADLETSLEEYGFVARPITVDYDDEYFVIYKMGDNQYGSGHIRETDLDNIVRGSEWADEDDIKSLLDFVGLTKEEWFELPFTHKFSDLVSYWGTDNVIGTDYYPNDKNWAFEEIGLESDSDDSDDKDDLVDYVIPTHYATALVNDDYSGLSDEEEQELNEFTKTVIERTGNANFIIDYNEQEYFSPANDINNLGSTVMKVYIRPNKDEYAGGGRVNKSDSEQKPYQVYNYDTQSIEGYFDNELEAEEFASKFKNATVYDTREYAKGGMVKVFDEVKKNGVITENQINLIKRRLNSGKDDSELDELLDYINENHPKLSDEQNKKGYEFLMNLWKSPTGKERINNPFGYREQNVLENFEYFELSHFRNDYYGVFPVYNVIGKSPNTSFSGSFQYYYDGKVNIIGEDGGMFANGGGVKNVSYEKIYDVLKENIDESVENLDRRYENSYEFTGEEIEHKFRDGFIPYTNGGYEIGWFEHIAMMNSAGYNLPTEKLNAEMQRHIDYSYELAKDSFKESYPEIVDEVGEENIDYNSLYDAGFTDEAEQLSEWESENMYDEDSIHCSISAYYYEPSNDRGQDGKHTIALQGVINLEAPYHRKGKNDDFTEIIFTFDSIEELKSKLEDGLKNVIDWFNGSKPTGSDDDSFAKGGNVDEIVVKSGNNGKLKVVFKGVKNQKNELQSNEVFEEEKSKGKSVFLFVNDELYDEFIADEDEDEYAKGGGVDYKEYRITIYDDVYTPETYYYDSKSDAIKDYNDFVSQSKKGKLKNTGISLEGSNDDFENWDNIDYYDEDSFANGGEIKEWENSMKKRKDIEFLRIEKKQALPNNRVMVYYAYNPVGKDEFKGTQISTDVIQFAKGGGVKGMKLPKDAKIRINYVDVSVYKDSYEEGETDNVNNYDMNHIKGSIVSPQELVNFLAKNIYTSENPADYVIMDNNIHTSQLQDADGSEASDSEREEWIKGNLELYSANFIISVSIISEIDFDDETLSSITGIGVYKKGGSVKSKYAKGGGVDNYNGKKEEIIKKLKNIKGGLLKKAPYVFERNGLIYVSAENGDNYADYDNYMFIDEKLEDLADSYDTYWDWENAGSIVLSPIDEYANGGEINELKRKLTEEDIDLNMSIEETKKVANELAKILGSDYSVNENVDSSSFDLDFQNQEGAGGSYLILKDGSVVNMAVPNKPIYYNYKTKTEYKSDYEYANGGGVDDDDWFWNYDYRHYLRDASPKQRSIVKQKFIEKGLKLDGSSPKHSYIVISTIKPSELKLYKKVGSDGIKFANGGYVYDIDGQEYIIDKGNYTNFKSGDMAYNPFSDIVQSIYFDKNDENADDEFYVNENYFKVIPKYENGGGVDDADWIEESLIDLQNETGFDDLVVNYTDENYYYAGNGDAEFLVFETENDAEKRAIERIQDDLEENPEYFKRDWLMNYIDAENFFTEVYDEWNEGYVNDIESENSDKYENRLIEEMVDNGIVSDEEVKEGNFNAEDYKQDFVNLMTKNQIEEGNGGLQHYIDNFGDEEAFKLVLDNNLIDIQSASENAVYTDGIAHFLSSYDGEQIDLSNGHVAYRTN